MEEAANKASSFESSFTDTAFSSPGTASMTEKARERFPSVSAVREHWSTNTISVMGLKGGM